jgi:hypothetical protein
MKTWGTRTMLLSSVLQILANSQLEAQPTPAKEAAAGFHAEMLAAAARETAGELIEEAVQSADGALRPSASEDQPKAIPPPGPSLEGMIQMVTKLQKEDQSRFLDVFE